MTIRYNKLYLSFFFFRVSEVPTDSRDHDSQEVTCLWPQSLVTTQNRRVDALRALRTTESFAGSRSRDSRIGLAAVMPTLPEPEREDTQASEDVEGEPWREVSSVM